ncbi:MarR family transcriptional regulator [Streptomyces sp. NPDC006733]|uniref:MarR family winged helix-turn-helix transcriptional regulator n=1 Tax=Streptomyces sp. NPDC006733 TaxID=3155460 RepID=UPI0033DC6BC1
MPRPEPPTPDGTSRQDFARLLQRLSAEMNMLSHDFAAAQGLHATDVQALLAVMNAARSSHPTPATPSWLSQELSLTSGAVTAVLDRLERAGHVRRARDGVDRRQVQIHYNPGAGSLAAAWFQPVGASTDAVRAEFTDAELGTVTRFLDRMTEELEELRHRRRDTDR